MLTRDEIDAIGDRFGYFKYGDAQGDQRAAFASAIEQAAYARILEMTDAAAKEWNKRDLFLQAQGALAIGDRVRSLMQEQPK